MTFTRRSAGIPALVQAILVTDPSRNNKPKLRETVEQLLTLTESSTTLLPARIHSLHVLHTLFLDSKLADYVVPYLGRAFEVSIRGFGATNWSDRNSSTMLYTILMTRMFNNRHNYTRQTADVTFFTIAPNLHPYFKSELERAVREEKSLYYPTLYPILIILQRLTPCSLNSGDPSLSVTCFVEPVTHFAQSGVEKTRKLAAETVASILATSQVREFLMDRLGVLAGGLKMGQNALQGTLHQIRELIPRIEDKLDGEIMGKILGSLSWILTDNPCPFTALTYIESPLPPMFAARERYCSPLYSWEIRLLLPACLENVLSHTKVDEVRASVLLCLVNSLQDEDDGVRRAAAGVILRYTKHPHLDTIPELVLPILLNYLIRSDKAWLPNIIQWAALSDRQELISSSHSDVYRSSSPSSHPLFEPDVINPYAEPLIIPRTLETCLKGAVREGLICEISTPVPEVIDSVGLNTIPELVLPILLNYLIRSDKAWLPNIIQWAALSDRQELISSSHSDVYRSSSPSSHPLFEPDVINPYAEPLIIPRTLETCLKGAVREGLICEISTPVPEVIDSVGLSEISKGVAEEKRDILRRCKEMLLCGTA
eukprot:sb/3463213/